MCVHLTPPLLPYTTPPTQTNKLPLRKQLQRKTPTYTYNGKGKDTLHGVCILLSRIIHMHISTYM